MRHTPLITSFVIAMLGLTQSSCRPPDAESAAAEVARQAAAYLQAQADAGFFSGAVLITRQGTPLYSGAFGWADVKRKVRNTTSTRFRIASITKTFTAALIMRLVEQERLSLDTTVGARLDSCPEAWRAITIHHLLTHTSGIPNFSDHPDFANLSREPYTSEQILGTIRDRALDFAPGEKYRYSNTNYLLLALLIEAVTNRTFADVLRAELLDPLGLQDTGVDHTASDVPLRATGYRPLGMDEIEAPHLEMSWVHGAGAMYSTVSDLQKWVQALAEGRVLPTATVQKMWQADKGAYGYGWQVLDSWPPTFGRPLVFHAGGLNGFAVDLLYFPNEQVTIAILANLESAPMAVLSRDLSAIVFGAEYTLPVVRKEAAIDPAILDTYVGNYQLAPQVMIQVMRENDRLMVQATGQPADIAIPESPTRFFSRRSDAQLTFVLDSAGRPSHLVLLQNGRELKASRQP